MERFFSYIFLIFVVRLDRLMSETERAWLTADVDLAIGYQ